MHLNFSFKANKETIKALAEQDFHRVETILDSSKHLRSGDLADYIEHRTQVEFFQGLYQIIRDADDSKVEDHLLHATRPVPAGTPFSRSTSVLANLLAEQQAHLNAVVHARIIQVREIRAERNAEAELKSDRKHGDTER